MKITIISASHRSNSQSFRIGKYLKKRLKDLNLADTVSLIDLASKEIPIWSENMNNKSTWQNEWKPVEKELKEADGLIFITPEWHGMVPAKLKNLFLLAGCNTVGHKPAMIVSVSTGFGGTYPINELRTSSYKNNRLCYIPEHLIIRKVAEVLLEKPNPDKNSFDAHIRPRVDYALQVLYTYTKAFKNIRSNISFEGFANGM